MVGTKRIVFYFCLMNYFGGRSREYLCFVREFVGVLLDVIFFFVFVERDVN